MTISNYIPLCNAIVFLLQPLIEIVIHDLKSGTICYINGDLSKRKIGDPSLLDPIDLEENLAQIVYPKINFDGRLVKSISIPIEKEWLFCINCDASVFSQIHDFTEIFLHHANAKQPESLFKNDWQEKIHIAVHSFLSTKGWHFAKLTSRQKKEVVRDLFNSGAFQEKNAADYIAKTLQLGRATVFKYLKEWRNS